MKRLATLLAGLLLSGVAFSAEQSPVYQAGSQYTAVLNTQHAQWHMVPRVRQNLVLPVEQACQSSVLIPRGLWLFTRDSNGSPELLAPSHTPLPMGHSGHIPIVACASQGEGLAIPANLIEWLNNNTGAIYVE